MDNRFSNILEMGLRWMFENLQLSSSFSGQMLRESTMAVDANETKLLEVVRKYPAKIIVTVIGGQGYLFGRGNQQISAAVIKKTGRENIIVVAAREKILSFSQGRLLADTGDHEVNQMLKGYYKIVTGYREELIFPLSV